MKRFETRESRFSNRVLMTYAAMSLPETLAIKAAAGDGSAEILLYGEIGYWGITATDFAAALSKAGDGPLTLRINSPGGDVFDGYAIYNMLKARTAPVSVVIDGLAASAASFIAMAGTTVTMGEPSMLMIHNSWGMCIGDRNDMLDMAATQEKIDGQIAAIYASKSGKSVDDLATMMNDETWLTASDALDQKFCDAVVGGKPDASALAVSHKPIPIAPKAAATSAEWGCAASRALPLDADKSWDGPAAAERMLDDAGFNGDSPDPAKAKIGFLAWDHHNPKLKGSYKLPFADIVDGKLTALKSGLDAAASRLPDTDIPDPVKTEARAVIDAYEAREKKKDAIAPEISGRLRRLRLAEAEAA